MKDSIPEDHEHLGVVYTAIEAALESANSTAQAIHAAHQILEYVKRVTDGSATEDL